MDTKPISNGCPKCQAPLPVDAPQGLCPKCLLAAVATFTEAGQPAGRPTPPALEEIAAAFPQLEILEFIGQGGMGFVFKARQPKLDRLVALKILPQSLAADPTFAERFNREARLLARLNHPGIVTVHDFGVTNHQSSTLNPQPFYYLLMEFVDGVNLRQAMQAGRFTPDQALAIVPKICEALQFAHNEGILHRDIKPENILLDAKGRVKIADFGIAKLVGEGGRAQLPVNQAEQQLRPTQPNLTEAGKSLGTPNYMAPEQLENAGEVDHRADIYSLGVVFYEMLTGELPRGRFAPPSQKSAADPRVDEVVLRALEKEKTKRPASADEVRTQVETIAATPDGGRRRGDESQTENKKTRESLLTSAATKLEPRFSRTAIVGAGFGICGVLASVLDAMFGDSYLLDDQPTMILMVFAVLLLLVSTILGWMAVAQIRHSEGKLRGMWLTVFDGLLFPLLALDIRFAWQANTIVQTLNTIDTVTSPSGIPPVSNDRFTWLAWITTVLVCIVSNILIAWSVGRMVNQRQPGYGLPQNNHSGKWAFGLFIAGTLGAILLLTSLPPSAEKFVVAFGDLTLILALVLAVMHWRECLGRFLVIALSMLLAGAFIVTTSFEFGIVPARQAGLQADFGPIIIDACIIE